MVEIKRVLENKIPKTVHTHEKKMSKISEALASYVSVLAAQAVPVAVETAIGTANQQLADFTACARDAYDDLIAAISAGVQSEIDIAASALESLIGDYDLVVAANTEAKPTIIAAALTDPAYASAAQDQASIAAPAVDVFRPPLGNGRTYASAAQDQDQA